DRHPRSRARRLVDRARTAHRPHLGLPGTQPQDDPALRRRPAPRLPRGGGARDGDPTPPACEGSARDDARARARPLVDRFAHLCLLHDQGAAGDLRRSLPPRPRSGGGRVTPVRISIVATVVAVVLLLVVFELIRSRRLRERYALLWLATGLVLVALSAWRGGLNTIAGWLGVRSYPPAVLFAVGLLFVIL